MTESYSMLNLTCFENVHVTPSRYRDLRKNDRFLWCLEKVIVFFMKFRRKNILHVVPTYAILAETKTNVWDKKGFNRYFAILARIKISKIQAHKFGVTVLNGITH